jgi:poly(3-hydroxybutyrate) depolymerase
MAVQFHTAHSALVQGAGVLAGVPYFCAEGSVVTALGRCMKDGGAIPVDALLERTEQWAREGAIDPVAGLAGDRVWLYRGAADPVVQAGVVDALERSYRAHVQDANLVRVEREGAGHNFPVAGAGESACTSSEPPYIASCGFDAAHALLQHQYGALEPPAASASSAALTPFDQRPYAELSGSVALDERGWLYVPSTCRDGVRCRLHVVFHGCRQGATFIGDGFARRAGYLQVAEANRIVLLLPQVKPTTEPLNPLGCWDWWGYEGSDYATQRGRQIRAVRAMIADLLAVPGTAP